MPRLFPRMSERPEEWYLNPGSPLADRLLCMIGPMAIYTNEVQVTRGLREEPTVFGTDPRQLRIIYDAELKRHVYDSPGRIMRYTNTVLSNYNGPITLAVWLKSTQNASFIGVMSLSTGGDNIIVENHGTNLRPWVHNSVLDIPGFANGKWHHGVVFSNVGIMGGVLDGYNKAQRTAPASPFSGQFRVLSWATGETNYATIGRIADACAWLRMLTPDEIKALADPSNVDLRVGGVPLILPPRRRYWPVVSEQALPKMVPWHLFQQVGV